MFLYFLKGHISRTFLLHMKHIPFLAISFRTSRGMTLFKRSQVSEGKRGVPSAQPTNIMLPYADCHTLLLNWAEYGWHAPKYGTWMTCIPGCLFIQLHGIHFNLSTLRMWTSFSEVWDLPPACMTLAPHGCLNLPRVAGRLGVGGNKCLLERVIGAALNSAVEHPLLNKSTRDPEESNNYKPVSNILLINKLIEWLAAGQL